MRILMRRMAAILWLAAGLARGDDFVRIRPGPGADLESRPRRGQREVLAKRGSFVDLVASPGLVEELRAKGFRLEVLQPDLDRAIAELERPGGGYFHRHREVVEELQSWTREYPEACQVFRVGEGAEVGPGGERREILVARLGLSKEPCPRLLVFGGIHARELGTVEVPLRIGRSLLTRIGTDAGVQALLRRREIWILPCLNPDGREYCFDHDAWWRKNRGSPSPPEVGVDLNRNFGWHWGPNTPLGGSSGHPGSGIYRGPTPFSEPEAQALRKLVLTRDFAASLSLHAYGNLVLLPFGYGADAPEHPAMYHEMASRLEGLTGFEVGQVAEVLGYYSNGRHDDWLYADRTGGKRMTAAVELEIGRSFFPTRAEVEELSRGLTPAVLDMARMAGADLEVSAEVGPDGQGGLEVRVRVRNLGIGDADQVVVSAAGTEVALGRIPGLGTAGLTVPAERRTELRFERLGRVLAVRVRARGEDEKLVEKTLPGAVD